MRARAQRFLLALALMLLLNACQAIAGVTLGEHIDARIITTMVKAKLAAEKNSPLMRDQVDTHRVVVQLSGVVASSADRSRAEQVAPSVSGIKNVVNNLQVR